MKERILIVEDETPVRNTTLRVLELKGFQVEGVNSAEEALERLNQGGYDLLLIDIRMPGMSGLELLRRVKATNPDAAALMITGYGSMDSAVESLELGAQGFILKPVAPESLARACEDALEKVRLAREISRLKALLPIYEVSRALTAETDLDRLFDAILNMLAQETKADRASLMLLDAKGEELSIRASYGLPAEALDHPPPKVGQGIAGWVAQKGQPLIIRNGYSDVPELRDQLLKTNISSALSLPLMYQGRVIGVVNLAKTVSKEPFSQSDLELFSVLAGQMAVAIENATLQEGLRQRAQELEREKEALEYRLREIRALNSFLQSQQQEKILFELTHRELETRYWAVLEAVADAVDGRVSSRQGHSTTIARWIVPVAELLGLATAGLREAAYLHDLGMVIIPEPTMLKTTPLTPYEWEWVKAHPGHAATILAEKDFPLEVQLAVLHHHENFDGTGYPSGLKGEDIPPWARLLRVLDSYQAMISPRPNRGAIDPEMAKMQLHSEAGKEYDPAMVEAFISFLESQP